MFVTTATITMDKGHVYQLVVDERKNKNIEDPYEGFTCTPHYVEELECVIPSSQIERAAMGCVETKGECRAETFDCN